MIALASATGVTAYIGSTALIAAGLAVAFAPWSALAGRAQDRDVVLLGKAGRRRTVSLGLDELQQGLLVAGAPGVGKSTLLVAMHRRLPEEIGCLVVDLKGEMGMAEALGIPPERVFRLGAAPAAAWNPFTNGNPASWRDVLMSTQEWTEPHYRQAAARFVGIVLQALQMTRGAVELDAVIEILEQPVRAKGLIRDLPAAAGSKVERAVDVIASEPSLRSGVIGLANRLALLRDSPASAGRFGAAGGIDLDGVLRGERVLFSLPAAEFPDEAPAIAAAVIQTFGAAGQRRPTVTSPFVLSW